MQYGTYGPSSEFISVGTTFLLKYKYTTCFSFLLKQSSGQTYGPTFGLMMGLI